MEILNAQIIRNQNPHMTESYMLNYNSNWRRILTLESQLKKIQFFLYDLEDARLSAVNLKANDRIKSIEISMNILLNVVDKLKGMERAVINDIASNCPKVFVLN